MNQDTLNYVKFFSEYEEEISWILRQQERLRLEYIMFLKKDLPEILHRQNITRHFWNKNAYNQAVKDIIKDYSEKIQTSIEMLTTDFVTKVKIGGKL